MIRRRARPETCTVCTHPLTSHIAGICTDTGCNYHAITVNARCNGPIREGLAGVPLDRVVSHTRMQRAHMTTPARPPR